MNKTNTVVYKSDLGKISLFFRQFAKIKTVCAVSIKFKAIGRERFETKAMRNRDAGDIYDESIGITFSGTRATEKLRKIAFKLEDKAEEYLNLYLLSMQHSRDLLAAADDLDKQIESGLKKKLIVSRNETVE